MNYNELNILESNREVLALDRRVDCRCMTHYVAVGVLGDGSWLERLIRGESFVKYSLAVSTHLTGPLLLVGSVVRLWDLLLMQFPLITQILLQMCVHMNRFKLSL